MKDASIPREEWDFGNCLDAERNSCIHYEYAREYVKDRPAIAQKLAGHSQTKMASKLFAARFSKHQPRSYILPIFCLQFPSTPWLKIPRQERRELIDLCLPQPGEGPNTDLLTDEKWELSCLQNFDEMRRRRYEEWQRQGEQWVKTDGRVDGRKVPFAEMLASIPPASLTPRHFYAYTGPINYAVITLDWSQSDNLLKQAFEQLLNRRPRAFPDPEASAKRSGSKNKVVVPARRGGRGGPHDKFNQLAALRLLNHYCDPEKVINFLVDSSSVLPYTNAGSIRSATRKARATLCKMEQEGQFVGFSGL